MGRQKYQKKKSKEVTVKTAKGHHRWTKGNASLSNPTVSSYRDQAKSDWVNRKLMLNNPTKLVQSMSQSLGNKHKSTVGKPKTTGADLLKLHGLAGHDTDKNLEESNLNLDLEYQNQLASSVIDDPLANIFGQLGVNQQQNQPDLASLKSNISGITDCTNNTFSRLQLAFDKNNTEHKHAIALFSAITDNIRNKGLDENDNLTYFSNLYELLVKYNTSLGDKSTKSNEDEYHLLAGVIYLLNMVLKNLNHPGILANKGLMYAEQIISSIKIFNSIGGLGPKSTLRAIQCLATINKYIIDLNSIKLLVDISLNNNYFKFKAASCSGIYQSICKHQSSQSQSSTESMENDNPTSTSNPVNPINDNLQPLVKYVITQAINFINQNGIKYESLPGFNLLRCVFTNIQPTEMKTVLEVFIGFLTTKNSNSEVKMSCMRQIYNIFKNRPANLSLEHHKLFLKAIISSENMPNIDDEKYITYWIAMSVEIFCSLYHSHPVSGNSELQTGKYACMNEFLLPMTSNCLSILVSKNRKISKFGSEVIRHNLIHKCLLDNPAIDVENVTKNVYIDRIREMLQLVCATLDYKHDHIWDESLNIINKFFSIYYKIGNDVRLYEHLRLTFPRLEGFKKTPNFQYKFEVIRCFENALSNFGPELFLKALPLNISGRENVNDQFDREWILPMLKKSLHHNVNLKFFFTGNPDMPKSLYQLSIDLFKRSNMEQNKIMKSILDNIFVKIWESFPAFCSKAENIDENTFSPKIAKDLYGMLNKNNLNIIWKPVILGVTNLAKNNPNYVKKFAQNYSKKFFNLFMGMEMTAENINKADLMKVILDGIEVLGGILDESNLIKNFQECIQNCTNTNVIEIKTNLLDIIIRLAKSLPLASKSEVFEQLLSIWISNSQELVDHSIKKKAYRALEVMIIHDAEFFAKYEELLIKEFNENLQNCSPSAKKSRLKIIESMMTQTANLANYNSFLPEIIVSYNDKNKDARLVAKSIITKLCNFAQSENDRYSILQVVMLSFEGDATIISKTIKVLTDMIEIWKSSISQSMMSNILDNALILLEADSREILHAVVNQLHLILTILPKDKYICHVKPILQRLGNLKPTTTSHFRKDIKSYLNRLVKIFGFDEIFGILPKNEGKKPSAKSEMEENDATNKKDGKNSIEILHKMMGNIKHVAKNRENKKARLAQENEKKEMEDASSDEGQQEDSDKPRKTLTDLEMGDILEYSDDSEDETEAGSKNKSKSAKFPPAREDKKKVHKFGKHVIDERNGEILDFNDPNANKLILSEMPKEKTVKKFKPDKFVKDADDGRIVVSMHDDELKNNNYPKGNLFDSDSDADSGESADEFEDFFNNSDDEAPNNPYIAGGGGIHRDMQKNSKNLSKKETEKLKKLTPSAGAKFRGKGKNKHDIKKKGEADPYSYVKIGSGINNKRKRRQISKNFKKEIKVLFKTSKGGKAGGKMD